MKILKKIFKRKGRSQYFWELRGKAKKSKNKFTKFYYQYLYKKMILKYNANIPLAVKMEDKPYFPHGIKGVFISSKAKIGKNCTIFHQVTIGSNTLSSSKKCGAPIIGNNVYIGCGAKIIGGISIGDNVRIGANCVVVDDVPCNSTVVMEKPRIITYAQPRDNNFVDISDYDA